MRPKENKSFSLCGCQINSTSLMKGRFTVHLPDIDRFRGPEDEIEIFVTMLLC